MRINTFFYSIRQGLKNIFRNKMFSLASVATMAACIFMFGLFYIIVTNFSATVHSIEEGVSVTVFFENDATDARSVTSEKRLISVLRSAKTSMCLPTKRGKNIKKYIFREKKNLRMDLQIIRLRILHIIRCI